MLSLNRLFGVFAAIACLGLVSSSAHAGLTPYDPPSLSCVSSGQAEITIKACAGASGAPAGITVHWMEKSVYDQFGWGGENECALSLSGQPSLQHPGASRWELGPNQCQEIQVGDINFDETGVSGTGCGLDPLKCGTEYVFRAFAHAGRGFGRSDWSETVVCSTQPCTEGGCTFTQGYWKNHGSGACHAGNNPNAWPINAMLLGTVAYTDVQLCSIFNQSAGGNGLIALAHQLMAAKLNIANGGGCQEVVQYINAADALIGNRVVPPVGAGFLNPASTSALTESLDQFNNGALANCPAHCGPGMRVEGTELLRLDGQPQTVTKTWGTVKAIYR